MEPERAGRTGAERSGRGSEREGARLWWEGSGWRGIARNDAGKQWGPAASSRVIGESPAPHRGLSPPVHRLPRCSVLSAQ